MTARETSRAALLASLLVCGVTMACRVQSPDLAADRAALVAINARTGKGHLDRDPAAFLTAVESGWWAAGNGDWTYRDKAIATKDLTEYFAHTTFEELRDVNPPDVHISPDGSTGWLRGEVEIRGTSVDAQGVRRPVHFRAAWLDVYEKRNGRWVLAARANTLRDLS